ncbi:MAG: hypothetical protein VKO64_01025 [Candidatus Sericytochromatia bacterium]|nr:hypothetical protein [Candidatus Sericytochromatia bacterium]
MTRSFGLATALIGPMVLAACGSSPSAWPTGPDQAMRLPGGMRAPDGLLGIQRWRDLDELKPRMKRQATDALPPVEALKKDLPERIAREDGEKRLVRIPRDRTGRRRGGNVGGLGDDPPDVVGFGALGGCGPVWNSGFWGGDAWSFAPYGWGGNLYMIPYALVGGWYVPAYVPFYYEAATLAPYQDLPLAYGVTPLVPQYVTTLAPFVGGVTPPVGVAAPMDAGLVGGALPAAAYPGPGGPLGYAGGPTTGYPGGFAGSPGQMPVGYGPGTPAGSPGYWPGRTMMPGQAGWPAGPGTGARAASGSPAVPSASLGGNLPFWR